MPFKSAKQRRFMHAKHPKIAKEWKMKYGSKPKKAAKKMMAKKRGGKKKR